MRTGVVWITWIWKICSTMIRLCDYCHSETGIECRSSLSHSSVTYYCREVFVRQLRDAELLKQIYIYFLFMNPFLTLKTKNNSNEMKSSYVLLFSLYWLPVGIVVASAGLPIFIDCVCFILVFILDSLGQGSSNRSLLTRLPVSKVRGVWWVGSTASSTSPQQYTQIR